MVADTNYESLSDQELDRLSAIKIMRGDVFETKTGDVWKFHGIQGISVNDWHPTDPNSNQCERYLFPKLGIFTICQYHRSRSSVFNVDIFNGDDYVAKVMTDKDQVNRTKTIACLMAFDKLNEASND